MNEGPRQNSFSDAAEPEPEQRPLAEHLKDITSKSRGAAVKAVATRALADGWSPADVRKALEALGVGPRNIKAVIPKPSKPRVPTSGGLSPDYFCERADGPVFRMGANKVGDFAPVLVCSPLKALYKSSDLAGEDWSLVVRVLDERGHPHDVHLPYPEMTTEPRAAVARMAYVGLKASAKLDVVLAAVLDAEVPLVRYLRKPGHHIIGSLRVFALPRRDGILGNPPPGETFLWKGDGQFCRVSVAGTLDGWKANVAAKAGNNPLPMVAIGTMLASPAIPLLPAGAELNTVLHLIGETSHGKTTTLQVGASVWGKGAKTDVEGSFLNTWRSTSNGVEALLIAGHQIGCCLDELKTLDQRAAPSVAYDIAGGRRKARLNADGSARKAEAWSLFALSSGEARLEEHANPASWRRREPTDAGAGARFIDIPADQIFVDLHGERDAKTFAETLGAGATTNYGPAGPAFVEWLLANPDEARERLKELVDVWGAVAARVLPPGPSAQALRVASRLGVIAAAAALAADVLALPWSAFGDQVDKAIDDAPLGDAAHAAFWAFAEALRLWIARHGGATSTEETALLDALRGFYLSRQHHFHPTTYKAPKGAAPTTIDEDDSMWRPASPRFGWRVMDWTTGSAAQAGLLHVDVLPETFIDALGWTSTKRSRAVCALNARRLIIPGVGQLQTTHWTDGRNVRVYRIKGEFFEE
jgi:Domain of unknown function (DUF927)